MDITLKQVGEKTGINISTVRFYKNKYLQYFTTSGEGNNTRYEEKSTVEIMNLIAKSYKSGFDYNQIIELIENRYGINIVTDLVTQDEGNNVVTAQQSMEISMRNLFKEEMEKHNIAIVELKKEVMELAVEGRERDTQSQIRDEILLKTMREMMSRRKPWWRFGR